MTGYPVDEMSLRLLAEACRMNDDTGQTHLGDFLEMGSRVESVTNEATGVTYATIEDALADTDQGDVPTFYVKHKEGWEPHSPQSVILSLVEEIKRLRAVGAGDGETPA